MPPLLSKFAVRSFLSVCTLLLMVLGVWLLFVFPIVRQHAIADRLEANGAQIKWDVGGAPWVEKYLGSYWCTEVVSVVWENNDDAKELMSWLPGLRSLQHLELAGNDLADSDLSYLAGLTQLNTLHIHDNEITDKGLNHLRQLNNLETLIHDEPVGRQGLKLLSNLPSLKMAYLYVDQVSTQDLLKFPGLSEIKDLSIERPASEDWPKAVAQCQNLASFKLSDASVTDQQLRAIIQANPLKSLYLTNVTVGDSVLPILADHPELHRIGLIHTKVAYGQLLANLGPQATSIVLYDNNIALLMYDGTARSVSWEGDPEIEDLSALKLCEKCTYLRMKGEAYYGSDLSVLPEMPVLNGIQLEGPLTDNDLRSISQIEGLRHVTLSGPLKITPQGMTSLQNVTRLQYLALFDADLTDAHFQEIGKLQSLHTLFLSDSNVTRDGIAYLSGLQSLEQLSFYDCHFLDDTALKQVAKLSSLAELTFNNVPITDEGLTFLYGMPNLRYVSLQDTDCTDDGEKKMDKLLPIYFQYHEFPF